MSRPLILLTLLILFFSPRLAHAKFFALSSYHNYGPIETRSQNPLSILFVGVPLEGTLTLPKKRLKASLETNFSNLFERRPSVTGTGIDLDMELLRTSFNFRYGIIENLELGLELPFLSFSGGFMDSFIQGYHQAFGFPNAGRDRVPNGRFNYQITQNGGSLFQADQSDFGLSDLSLFQKFKFMDESKSIPGIAFKSALKIPSGNSGEATGSGRVDFAFSLLAEKSFKRLHGYTQLGLMALGGHGTLDPILRKAAFFFAQAFEFNVTEHMSFVGQINGNTSLFKNVTIPELSRAVFDLTFGFTGQFPLKGIFKTINYQAAFTEDPAGFGPSVDFTLFFKAGVEY